MRRFGAVTNNIKLKLFSLLLGTFLFLFVSVESATPINAEVRLDYQTREDVMVVGEPPEVVHTVLRGPWAAFLSLDAEQMQPLVIDLSGAGPGTIRRRIEIDDIEPPPGMEVISVRPAEIEVQLARAQ